MPLIRILPYVGIVLVGQAVLDAGPAIVAEREGGMGLGSALIGALVTQIAGIVLGAAMAGVVVDRRSASAATLGGAFLAYAGLMATGIAPMGSLGTVMAGMGVAGIGFGAMLTAAFSVAAGIESARERAAAVVLLLVAPVAARIVVGSAFAAGPMAFLVGGAAIVGLALAAVRLAGAAHRQPLAPRDAGPATRAVAAAALSGLLLAIGSLLAVAGADPSRLSASLIAGSLGMGGFQTIDTARGALLAAGVVLLLAGAAALVSGTDRTVRAAVPALFLVGLAGAGIAAMLTQAMTAGRIPDATSVLIGVATALGGAIGLATGGWLVAYGRTGRVPAVIGSASLTVACALGVLTVTGQRPDPGAALPLTLIGIAGLGLGLVASALRLALTDVEPHRRGLAAGAGVVAAVSGSALGGMIGAGEGLNMLRGDVDGVAIGLIGFVVAAAVAVALAATLPARPIRPTSAPS